MRAPFNLFHVTLHCLRFFLALLDFQFQELGAEHVKAHRLVLELRAFVLALYHDPRREVGDTNGGRNLIDVLTACAARMVNVDTNIVVVDFHFVVVFDFGHNFEGREGRLTALVGVERGDAHQTVYAHFRLQIAVSVFPFDAERNAFQACAVARFAVEFKHLKAHLFAVAGVHSVQHLTPVTGFRAACACVQGKHGVMAIVRALQDSADAHIFDVLFRNGEHFVKLGNQAFVFRFFDEIDDVFRVRERGFARFVSVDFRAHLRDFSADFRRLFQILPNVGVFLFLFQFRKTGFQMLDVQRVARLVQDGAHGLYFQSIIVSLKHIRPYLLLLFCMEDMLERGEGIIRLVGACTGAGAG